MSEGYTPERLLGEISRQDEGAFRMFYDITAPRAFGLILRVCRDRSLAEEALVQTYSAVWLRAGVFDPVQNSGMTWLMAIARNRAMEARQKQKAPSLEELGDSANAASGFPDIQFARPGHRELDALLSTLETLGEKQREAILLAYYDGRSAVELGVHFGVRSNMVEGWLKQGLRVMSGELPKLSGSRGSLKAAGRALGLKPIQLESTTESQQRRQWELTFAPLGLAVQEKEPPSDLYLRVVRTLDRRADRLALRRAKRAGAAWRWVAIIALILAAVFAYLAFAGK